MNNQETVLINKLLQNKKITHEQLRFFVAYQKELQQQGRNVSLTQILIHKGIISNQNFSASTQTHSTSETHFASQTYYSRTTQSETTQKKSKLLIALGAQFLHYKIEKELGRGGMGAVYKAFDLKLQRHVALKVMLLQTQSNVERFIREAQAIAKLKSPHIVQIMDVGNQPQIYFTMEYVAGNSLDKYIYNKEKSLTWKQIAILFQKLAIALSVAHTQRVIHRDIKPSNVMIDKFLEPKLMDFGLVKMDEKSSLTQDFMGTPVYASPEQVRNKNITHATDIYSLGASLYEVLTKRKPFQGEPANVIYQVMNKEVIPLYELNPDIPRDLEAICLKCIEKNAKHRYFSAIALARDLQNYLENKSILAKKSTPIVRLWKIILRNKLLTFVILFTFLILSSALMFVYVEKNAAQKERDSAKKAKKTAQKERDNAEKEKEAAQKEKKLAENARYYSVITLTSELEKNKKYEKLKLLWENNTVKNVQDKGIEWQWLNKTLQRLKISKYKGYFCQSFDGKYVAIANNYEITIYKIFNKILIQYAQKKLSYLIGSIYFKPSTHKIVIFTLAKKHTTNGQVIEYDVTSKNIKNTNIQHSYELTYLLQFINDDIFMTWGKDNSKDMVYFWSWNKKKIVHKHQYAKGIFGDKTIKRVKIVGQKIILMGLENVEIINWKNKSTSLISTKEQFSASTMHKNNLFLGNKKGNIKVWNTKKEKWRNFTTQQAHFSRIVGLFFNKQENTIFSSSYNLIRVWDMNGKLLREYPTVKFSTGKSINDKMLLISPNLLMLSDDYLRIHLLNLSMQNPQIVKLENSINSIDFANGYLGISARNHLHVYGIKNKKMYSQIFLRIIRSCVWAENNLYAAVYKEIEIVNQFGQKLGQLKEKGKNLSHSEEITFLIAKDHYLISISSRNRMMKIWDTRKKQIIKKYNFNDKNFKPYAAFFVTESEVLINGKNKAENTFCYYVLNRKRNTLKRYEWNILVSKKNSISKVIENILVAEINKKIYFFPYKKNMNKNFPYEDFLKSDSDILDFALVKRKKLVSPRILCATDRNKIEIWALAKRKASFSMPLYTLQGSSVINACLWLEKEKTIVCGDEEGNLRIWDLSKDEK